jgi:hypothetical protein
MPCLPNRLSSILPSDSLPIAPGIFALRDHGDERRPNKGVPQSLLSRRENAPPSNTKAAPCAPATTRTIWPAPRENVDVQYLGREDFGFGGDPSGSRTRVPDVRGRCPNH